MLGAADRSAGVGIMSPGAEPPTMDRSLREPSVSALFVLVATVALWPPRAVYWDRVAAVVGGAVTVAAVAALALGLGAAFAWRTRVRPSRFVLGGLVAYAVGMVAVEVAVAPDSPAHLVWYAGLVGCLVTGVVIVRWRGSGGSTATDRRR